MGKATEEQKRKMREYHWANRDKILKRKRIYNKKRYAENKEYIKKLNKMYLDRNPEYKKRMSDYINEFQKKNRIRYRERVNKQKRIYHQRKEVKLKKNIIGKTKRKFGKLKTGFEYHHNTIPYQYDKFTILERPAHSWYHHNIKRLIKNKKETGRYNLKSQI